MVKFIGETKNIKIIYLLFFSISEKLKHQRFVFGRVYFKFGILKNM